MTLSRSVEDSTLKDLKTYVGGLSKPSKMPGWAYGLPAQECKVGSQMRKEKGSTCEGCYAFKAHYVMYKEVKTAQYNRLSAITKEHWVPAMVRLISHYSSEVFRWHDAGDIMSLDHLSRIVKIAKELPNTAFWIPTREVHTVRRWRDGHSDNCATFCNLVHIKRKEPENLRIRLSALMNNTKPPKYSGLSDLTTSTVHSSKHLGKPGESIECGAYKRNGECGACRACWSPKVKNVSYRNH